MIFMMRGAGLVLTLLLSTSACAKGFKMPSEKEVFEGKQTIALAKAACKGDVDKIDRLVADGANVNAPSVDGANVLAWALACKNLDGVKALLKHGADPNARITYGHTAVLFVGRFDDVRFLEVLLDHGGDVDAYNDVNKFDTALRRTFAFGVDTDYWAPYHLLIERGANYDQENEVGIKSFLDFAAGTYARFGEAERLFDMGFEGDLDALIKMVEDAKHSLLPKPKEERAKFLKKLYRIRDERDAAQSGE